MVPPEPEYDPASVEEEARGIWRTRQIPPPGGQIGPRDGPLVLQFEGTCTPGDLEAMVAQRGIAADVDARYLALAGRSALGTLRLQAVAAGAPVPAAATLLERLGVWTGGDGTRPWDSGPRTARVQTLVGRLAHRGLLVSRDLPLRACPTCGEPRSPERIVYQEEEGDAYLVRFPVALDGRRVDALVWVDAPWRLLGTSALLIQPEAPYVIARQRRGDVEDLVLTSRSSLDRFREWVPRASFEIVEEHPGRFFEGKPYEYPLRHEFPTGGALDPPSGTILAVTDVTDTGTGIVPLVPGHGSTDAEIAARAGVAGWPLVTPHGQLDLTLMHKYAGLDLPTGSEFILRDLGESDAIFATLRVRRGVPHCAVCGSALLWIPGRAWCLEPSRLPEDRRVEYARLLPRAPPLDKIEVAPWPVSASTHRDEPETVALLECSRCDRLEALDGPVACPCGARRYPVQRRLVTSVAGALAAWARLDPFPDAPAVRLYVGDRRRVPSLVHHLMAAAALEHDLGDVGLSVLPTITDASLAELVAAHGADAVRCAFVRSSGSRRASASFADRCRVERGRLSRLWGLGFELLAATDAIARASFAQPIVGFLGELEPEDRAFLARWERERVRALAEYERYDPGAVHRRLVRFLETDLATYREWTRGRMGTSSSAVSRRAVLRTLAHVLRDIAWVLAPIAPHTSESLARRLGPGRASLFEGTLAGADRGLLNEELVAGWDRWMTVLREVADFRRAAHLAPSVVIPTVVLVAPDDDLGDRLRADGPVLERLGHVRHMEVGSPRAPWTGRQGKYQPVESEIQRLYPSQSTQISHLLARTPPRGLKGGASEITVVVQGLHIKILPSMVEYVETLPPGYLPHPWTSGEMYLEVPHEGTTPTRVPPPLSRDAFWVVRRIERRLARAPPLPDGSDRIAVVAAAEPLAGELRAQTETIARYLGLRELRVVDGAAETPAGRIVGRTHSGAAWWIDLPGVPPEPVRVKHRQARPRCRRVPAVSDVAASPAEDFGSDEVVGHWESVRALGSELDGLLEVPLLGPTKVDRAWAAGFDSVDAYRNASFEQLVELPGFGPAIAARFLEKLGRVPPPPARPEGFESRPIGVRPVRRPSHPLRPREDSTSVVPAADAAPPTEMIAPPPIIGPPPPDEPPASGAPSIDDEPQPVEIPADVGESESETDPEMEGSLSGLEPPIDAEPPPDTSSDSGVDEDTVSDAADDPATLESQFPASEDPTPGEVPLETPTGGAETDWTADSPPVSDEPSPTAESSPDEVAEGATDDERPAISAHDPEMPAAEEPVQSEPSPSDASAMTTPVSAPGAEELPISDVAAAASAAAVGSVVAVGAVLLAAEEREAPSSPSTDAAPEPAPGAGISDAAPEPTASAPEPEPVTASAPSGIELVVGSSPFTSIQPFLDATAAGHRGLCLVRDSPERVAAQVRPRPVDVYWLTNLGRGKTVRPSDLPGIFALLDRAISEDHVTALFLEGIEYLVRIHGIDELFGRLEELDRRARAQDARVWVHLTPDLLRPADLDRIVRAFGRAGANDR